MGEGGEGGDALSFVYSLTVCNKGSRPGNHICGYDLEELQSVCTLDCVNLICSSKDELSVFSLLVLKTVA